MRHRTLGRTGMQVSELCLGTMMLGAWGNADHDDCARIVHRALDAGVDFIDTADVYSAGESEEIVGKAIKGRRDDVIVATKFHHPMGPGVHQRGSSRRWIVKAVEDSLRRLGTDWIDLYYAHRPDDETDVDETLAALTDLVRAGKIRAYGCSAFPAHRIVEAQWVSERRNRERFTVEQPEYSILVRTIEADVLPVCQEQGMGVASWSPLAGGWLTGRYRKDGPAIDTPGRAVLKPRRFDQTLPHNAAKLDAVEALALLAEEAGISLIHLALAFVAQHPAITAPIIGPRTLEQLESQLGAVEVTLTDDVLDAIDAIVPPGTAINAGEPDWLPAALKDPALRRRRPGAGAAATAWTPPR